MHEGSFGLAIEEHLDLKRRNSRLEGSLPLSRYLEIVAAEETDVAVASRSVAAETADLDPPTEPLVRGAHLVADPDSWWDAGESAVGWAT